MARHISMRTSALLVALAITLLQPGRAQQQPVPVPPPFRLPDVLPAEHPVLRPEEPVFLRLDGTPFRVPTFTSVAHTRPEQAHHPVPAPSQQPNQALGDRGVMPGEPTLLPFGTKGERAGIAFGSGFFVPPPGEKIQPALQQQALEWQKNAPPGAGNAAEQPSVFALLLLNDRLMPATEAKLRALGVTLYAPYPTTAWQARIPVRALQAVAALPEVLWIGQPTMVQKLHPDLWRALAAHNPLQKTTLPLYVALFAPDTDGEARNALHMAGGEVRLYDEGIQVVQVDAPLDALPRLAELNSVLYVEPVPRVRAQDTQSMSAINADLLWGVYAPSSSTKVRVGILDTGLYVYHTDFANVLGGTVGYNLIPGESYWNDLDGHGTHVAGTFFGAGRGQGRYRGVAANLTTRGSFSDPDLVVCQVLDRTGWSVGNSILQGLQAINGEFRGVDRVQVFNASLSASGTGLVGTDAYSRKVDEITRNNVLAVISASNDGPGGSTVGTPGVAKNALTVGSVNDNLGPAGFVGWPGNNDDIATYSSRGPTGDNRTKPDVVAPGSWIDSVR
ncbi:MAG: S8 family serine peptidase, partial [Chthonomonadaceae bacterium]|nr:S8 family serine peptidase [Chthonomonadaceae bacterium]